ncbi:hypothetical protein [Paenisporosarcina cavernae]|nr:hypothetical protein [Paenisporosarcina cavernae]
MGNLEREYPVLREHNRRKESRTNNRRAMLVLCLAIIGIVVKVFFYS